MAALASKASSDFFTYKYFNQHGEITEEALVMKITSTGIHVMILKYGIEGLLETDQ